MRELYKKIKESSKSHKGITIIALIITIVVLLILAGVTIANISGSESVPNQAAIQRDKAAIAKEQQILENTAISITRNNNIGKITENSLRNELSSYNVDIVKSGGLYRITFKDSNNLYKMDEEGEFFYWEDMAPTDIYAKKDGTILYLRSTQPDTSYVKGTAWNDSTITKVVIEEPIAPSSCEDMFKNCTTIEEIKNIENLHTENVITMKNMFNKCEKLKSIDLRYFDTSKVTDLTQMFYGCNSLSKLDFSCWDTKNLEIINYLVCSCINITNINMKNFNTSNVKQAESVFQSCVSLTYIDLSSFNTENIEILENMFNNCQNLKVLDLSSFDTKNVTNMKYLFRYCYNLTKIFVSDKFTIEKVDNDLDMFLRCYVLSGEKGTTYDKRFRSKDYARIDDPEHDKPGYFTLKQ